MDMDLFRNKNVMLCILAFIILLSITAEKYRQSLGADDAPYKTRKERYEFLNCFDMRTGTLVCAIEEGMKFYFFIRYELDPDVRQNKEGFLVKYNVGPFVTAGLDFLETIYTGGTKGEAISRAKGAFHGALIGGFLGGKQFDSLLLKKWLGFMVGSHLGSWYGGRVGLMTYDVVQGFKHTLHRNLCYKESKTIKTPPH